MSRIPGRRKVKPVLIQQETDFTAEGAPPPGKVATAEPAMPAKSEDVRAPRPSVAAGVDSVPVPDPGR